jgi:ribosomal protein L14E/L6E/L27E
MEISMTDYKIGNFVKATSGRDKGKVYIIKNATDEYVYLVDGFCRSQIKPKRKNKKHVVDLSFSDENLIKKWENGHKVIDEEIKRAIKIYKQNINIQ